VSLFRCPVCDLSCTAKLKLAQEKNAGWGEKSFERQGVGRLVRFNGEKGRRKPLFYMGFSR
jgi:hypothetical protein